MSMQENEKSQKRKNEQVKEKKKLVGEDPTGVNAINLEGGVGGGRGVESEIMQFSHCSEEKNMFLRSKACLSH